MLSRVGNVSGLPNSTHGSPSLSFPALSMKGFSAATPYQALLDNVTSMIANGHIKQYYAYMPNLHPSIGFGVSPLYTSQPAPMGIADYGLGAAGSYTYYTSSFNGTVTLNSYSTYTPGNMVEVTPNMSGIQLNTVLANVTVGNTVNGVYWIQNVALLNGTTLTFIDNIWNFSSSGATIGSNTIYSGNGSALSGFYYYVGPTIQITYPLTLSFYNNALVYRNHPTVFFNYSYSMSGRAATAGSYDTVMFNSTVSPAVPAFEVNGSAKTPAGLMYDSELIFGGPGGGSNAMIQNMSGQSTIQYMASGAYRNIKSAYSYGSDTGETSQGMSSWWIGHTECLSQGPSNLSGLWNTPSSEPSGYIHLSAHLTPSWAFAFAGDGQSSYAPVSPSGYLNFTVSPGTYKVVLMADGYAQDTYSFSTNISTSISMTSSPGLLYAPIYIRGNTQSGAITSLLSSAGRISHLTVQLNSSFMIINDFGYPTFVLFDADGVTNSLLVQNLNESNHFVFQSGAKLSSENYNQKYDFFFCSHSILRNVSFSGGMQMANIAASNGVIVENISGNNTLLSLIGSSRNVSVSNVVTTGGYGVAALWSSSITVTGVKVTIAHGARYSAGALFLYDNHSSVSGLIVTGNGTSYMGQTIGVISALSNYSSADNMSVANGSFGYLGYFSFHSSVRGLTVNNSSAGFYGLFCNSSDVSDITAGNHSLAAIQLGSYASAAKVKAEDNSAGVILFGNHEHIGNVFAVNNSTAAGLFGNFSTVSGVNGIFAENGFMPATANTNSSPFTVVAGGNDTVSWLNETGYYAGAVLMLDHSTLQNYAAFNSLIGLVVGGPGHNLVSQSNVSEDGVGAYAAASNSTYNFISAYNDGIGFTVQCNDSSFALNTISNDSSYGVNISYGTGNHVYDNSFVDNNGSTGTYNSSHIQAYSVAGNFFNVGMTGNYWADWHLAYANGTLEPYLVSNGVYDYHPLGSVVVTTFQVTFTETGLPAGTLWFVNLTNGQKYNSTSTGISFTEINGVYGYTVSSSNKEWSPLPASGSFTVNNASASIPISFSLVTYSLAFTETGLPAGSGWSVSVDGHQLSSTTSSITFMEPNGTYTFSVQNLTDFYASPAAGQVKVDGAGASESVQFAHYAYITGSVSPSNAVVSVNGVAVTVSGGSFNTSVTAGTYAVTASLPGYKTSYSNVTVTAGQTLKLTITLTQIPSTGSHKGSQLPMTYIEIGGLALVIVVIAAVAAFLRSSRKRK